MKYKNAEHTEIDLEDGRSATLETTEDISSIGDGPTREEVERRVAGGEVIAAYVAPVETWLDKRLKSIADGGYGTVTEQLEIIGEQGIAPFKAHIATVKAAHPKPV